MTTALKDLLSDIFEHDSWKYNLLRNWNRIMGPLCQKVRIEKILDDTLVLGVINASWMQELYLLSSVIIKTINKNLDKPRIKKIRFTKIGRVKRSSSSKTKTQPNNFQRKICLTPRQKNALEPIKDQELRNALEQFLKRCYGEQK